MSEPYTKIPSSAKRHPQPYTLAVPEEDLTEFKTLLQLSRLGPETWEGKQGDRPNGISLLGITRAWLSNAKDYWLKSFDWRAHEKHINSFPNFKLSVKDKDGDESDIHFAALFSEKKDAIPIVFLHGWPGSFLEFLPMLSLLKKKYSPKELPYHVIVPSLPGYTLSAGPPLDKDFNTKDASFIINGLMIELGFGNGYVAQGGDVGSFVASELASQYDECKAKHVNMMIITDPLENAELSDVERKGLQRTQAFRQRGFAYAQEHGTRPSTIGHVLSSNPLALLAWIGEKFLDWTEEDPTLDTILESVSLYWFTDAFPRSIYPYRGITSGQKPPPLTDKPFGFSYFPFELSPVPKAWAATEGNLVFHREHIKGGHFAAMEQPSLLLQDIEEFVQQVWPGISSSRL
ncbi:epoxide hydrolase 1 [Mytilinidion resinicola]|uniref:Epoxide hydrolase 1 n=1 Tax=Mytilinidion resinicola TaxID=574789 RepID=A0A6A6YHB1_9PEZI|nr:epoxide hydrolase 1 [Mytilinidion resinicola]KAF2808191.1 epoxide hydrolase 1 [Mytilinidion resinicola]